MDPSNVPSTLQHHADLRAQLRDAWGEPGELSETLQRCAIAIVEGLHAALVRVWLIHPETGALVCWAAAGRGGKEGHGVPTEDATPHFDLRALIEHREPVLTNDFLVDPRGDTAWGRREGVQAFAGCPLQSQGHTMGVLALYSREGLSEDAFEALGVAADLISFGIERLRAEARVLRQSATLELLARASALLGSSLDYNQTLTSVAKMVVPHLADWCTIHLMEGEAQIPRQLVTAHVDARKVEWARELGRRYPADPSSSQGPMAVIRTGKPELYTEISEELVTAAASDEEHQQILRELGMRSLMSVPLTARGRTFGAMTLISAESGRRYTDEDLSVARELADRAAHAVDNARLYRDAQQAIHVRDEFLSIASHELKTPLTPLHLQLESIRRISTQLDGELLGTRVIGKLETMARQVDRLEHLVNSLLEIGRVTTGRLVLDLDSVDLGEVVREVVRTSQPAFDSADCDVRLEVQPGVVGRWDRKRLEQVVHNLLSNALKFGRGRPITLRVAESNGVASLSVTDEGIGISREDQARIFERFERAVATRHYGGFGLGLWIVRQIAEAMGGRVEVESSEGEGATFRVELPIGSSESFVGAPGNGRAHVSSSSNAPGHAGH